MTYSDRCCQLASGLTGSKPFPAESIDVYEPSFLLLQELRGHTLPELIDPAVAGAPADPTVHPAHPASPRACRPRTGGGGWALPGWALPPGCMLRFPLTLLKGSMSRHPKNPHWVHATNRCAICPPTSLSAECWGVRKKNLKL